MRSRFLILLVGILYGALSVRVGMVLSAQFAASESTLQAPRLTAESKCQVCAGSGKVYSLTFAKAQAKPQRKFQRRASTRLYGRSYGKTLGKPKASLAECAEHAHPCVLKSAGEGDLPNILAELLEEKYSGGGGLMGQAPFGVLSRPDFQQSPTEFFSMDERASQPLYIAFHTLRL